MIEATGNAHSVSDIDLERRLYLDVFENVFAATGEDWVASLAVFRAAASNPDPYGNLQDWLESSEDVSLSLKSATDRVANTSREGSADGVVLENAEYTVESRLVSRGPCREHRATTMVCPP